MGFSIGGAIDGGATGSSLGPWGVLGGGILGGLFGGDAEDSVNSARQVNDQNIALNRENRAWLEMMSNTAHQREVKDLKAAGLNPILSANGGAHVPGASPAVIENPKKNLAADHALIGNLMANTAKIVSEIALNRKLSETEVTKQELNRVQTENLSGQFSIPGFFRAPLSRMGAYINSAFGSNAHNSLSDSWAGKAIYKGAKWFYDRKNS